MAKWWQEALRELILSEAKDLCHLLGLGKLHRSFASLRMTG